jgi:hypothetical protein
MGAGWLTHTWWTHAAAPHAVYHWFNLAECAFWLGCAAVVLRRWRKRPRALELAYALAFVTFAATDLREAYSLQTWLIAVKALNLAALVWLRARLRPLYPGQPLLP